MRSTVFLDRGSYLATGRVRVNLGSQHPRHSLVLGIILVQARNQSHENLKSIGTKEEHISVSFSLSLSLSPSRMPTHMHTHTHTHIHAYTYTHTSI